MRNISKFVAGPGSPVSPTYITWVHMKVRCLKPSAVDFNRYGGRGIKVCERWMTYANFLADMGPRPTGLQLDRIDNDSDYTSENCRWVSVKTNARNRSSNLNITLNGETRVAIEWCELLGLRPETVYKRVKRGLPAELILSKGRT